MGIGQLISPETLGYCTAVLIGTFILTWKYLEWKKWKNAQQNKTSSK